MKDLLTIAVDILNLELQYLNEIAWLDEKQLARYGKKLSAISSLAGKSRA